MTQASASPEGVETQLQAFRIATLVLHTADIYESRAILKQKPEYVHLRHPKNKRTLLSQLLLSDSMQAIEALIEAGADVNLASKNGFTPLHIAAGHTDDKMLRFLLERGAHVNAVDGNGATPLVASISRANCKECIIALLEAGADITIGSNDGTFEELVERHIPGERFAEVHAMILARKLEQSLKEGGRIAQENMRKRRF